jgi:hypothetical protein
MTWAAQRANAGNRPDVVSTTRADDIPDTFQKQAVRRLSRRFLLSIATAATVAELARIGGAA